MICPAGIPERNMLKSPNGPRFSDRVTDHRVSKRALDAFRLVRLEVGGPGRRRPNPASTAKGICGLKPPTGLSSRASVAGAALTSGRGVACWPETGGAEPRSALPPRHWHKLSQTWPTKSTDFAMPLVRVKGPRVYGFSEGWSRTSLRSVPTLLSAFSPPTRSPPSIWAICLPICGGSGRLRVKGQSKQSCKRSSMSRSWSSMTSTGLSAHLLAGIP